MKVCLIQHVPFEGPGYIKDWCDNNRHELHIVKLFDNEPLITDFDLLIVMGGPMNIFEEDQYPFLKSEKELIKQSIGQNKAVLGICLGAQLIANVLGSNVYPNKTKEIGWFPIFKSSNNRDSDIPNELMVFHWHGDTFELPESSTRLFENEVCINQGFQYKHNVIGLQFHIEMNAEGIRSILDHCGDEIVEGEAFIQSKDKILSSTIPSNNQKTLYRLLDQLSQ